MDEKEFTAFDFAFLKEGKSTTRIILYGTGIIFH